MSLIYTIFEGKESRIVDEKIAKEFLLNGGKVQVTGPLKTIYSELEEVFPYPFYRPSVARQVGDKAILFISECLKKEEEIPYPQNKKTGI